SRVTRETGLLPGASPWMKTGGQRLTDIPVFPGVRPAPAFVAGARVGRTSTRRSRGSRVTRETGLLPGASPWMKTGGQRLTDIPVFPGVRPAPAFVAGARVGRTSTRRSRGSRVTRETGLLPGASPWMKTGGQRLTDIPVFP